MSVTNLFHRLARNAKKQIFSIALEEQYFNNFPDYFSEIFETATQLAISEEILEVKDTDKLQITRAMGIVHRHRKKYVTLPYDEKLTLFFIDQIKVRIASEFNRLTTAESKKTLLNTIPLTDLYKYVDCKARPYKLTVCVHPDLVKYFKEPSTF